MATIPDALKATLDAGWTGAGGVEPTYYVGEDYNRFNMPPTGQDYIWIDSISLKSPPVPTSDEFVDITNTIDIFVNTLTSADRREEIANEVTRILNGTAIAGVDRQWISDREVVRPDKIFGQQMERIQVTMAQYNVIGATSYGATTTTSLTVDNLTVNVDLDASGATVALGTTTMSGDIDMQGNELVFDTATLHDQANNFHMHPASGNADIKLVLHPLGTNDSSTFQCRNTVNPANYGALEVSIAAAVAGIISVKGGSGTQPSTLNINDANWNAINIGDASAVVKINGYDHTAALMIGSANAAWVPCGYQISNRTAIAAILESNTFSNYNAFLSDYLFALFMPVSRGSEKLYISGTRIGLLDADANNYIDITYTLGAAYTGTTIVNTDNTNYTSAQLITDTYGAVDMSGYEMVTVYIRIQSDTNSALNISSVSLRCYYDT